MGRHFVQQVSQKGFPLHPYPLKICSRYFIGLGRVCEEVIHLFHHDCHGRFHRQRGTDQDNIEYYKLLFFLSRSQSGRVTACGLNNYISSSMLHCAHNGIEFELQILRFSVDRRGVRSGCGDPCKKMFSIGNARIIACTTYPNHSRVFMYVWG